MNQEEMATVIGPVVRRVVAARVSDKSLEDDLVQGTIERIITAAPNLHKDTLVGYAVISARNAVAQYRRTQTREAAAYERSAESILPEESAETALIASEERTALLGGLNSLNKADRELIFSHHVDGEDVIDLANSRGITSGALAVRLSRARAALRLNYMLAHRNVTLPTRACRSVLLALSSADTRAQARLDVADHLDRCEICEDMAPALAQRQRGMVAGVPVLGAWQWMRNNPLPSVTVSTGVAVAAGTFLLLPAPIEAASPPSPAPAVSQCSVKIAGGEIDPASSAVPMAAGDSVVARNANVYAVSNTNGFWVGCGNYRLWVQTPEVQSVSVSGRSADVEGTVAAHDLHYAHGRGMDSTIQEQLNEAAYHAEAVSYRVY